MNKCIKIILDRCLNRNIKEVKQVIRDMSYVSCKAANKSIRMWLYHTEDILAMKNEDKNFNQKIYEKETYGKTYQNVIEGEMKKMMSLSNTSNVGTLHQQLVQSTWGRLKNDILSCKTQLPTFKIDTPYYFKNDNYTFNKDDSSGKLIIGLSFFSKEGLKRYGFKTGEQILMTIDKLNKSEKASIYKIIKGNELTQEIKRLKAKMRDKKLSEQEKEILQSQIKILQEEFNKMVESGEIYKQGSAQISINKKGKIEFIISFTYNVKKKQLNPNKILGIDLGITNLATMSIYDVQKEEFDYINYKYNQIQGKELIAFRQKLYNMGLTMTEINKAIYEENRQRHQKQLNKYNLGAINGLELKRFRETTEKYRKDMSIASKYCGEGRCGHGYKAKMKPINRIRNKINNFADTFNHKYSRYIINFAIKNDCGVIQMEDLTGATKNVKDKFLKDWSYYDLQQKIMYKAEERGIKVIKINPKYTSKRCSKCGNIHNENRDCKNNQAKFECKICGHSENADINASKNIAIPYIDKIIEQYINNEKSLNI